MMISILGSGWLGLPLAKELIEQGHNVKLSTRSEDRLPELVKISASAYIIEIEALIDSVNEFLVTDILIINITSKDISAYSLLIKQIEKSTLKQVLFVSSTSVYHTVDSVVTEDGGMENPASVPYQIEQLFCLNKHFQTTILRLSGLIGYSRHPGHFFKNGKVVQQPDSAVNLIHRDDCIGIINSIIKQEEWGRVFNACATMHPTKREFYTHARVSLGLIAPEFNERTANITNKIVSNNKVINILGYDFIYPDLMTLYPFSE